VCSQWAKFNAMQRGGKPANAALGRPHLGNMLTRTSPALLFSLDKFRRTGSQALPNYMKQAGGTNGSEAVREMTAVSSRVNDPAPWAS
jgi:hypothetical protein